ncbi:MAG: hypothetical protein E7346_05735 [Clostridiales bacterium]|nr:hypothetical protein [Clostridiales bacterium]
MNKFKRILLIALSILSVSCFALASGCAKDPLDVDRTPSGSLDLQFEYMTDAEIPYDAFPEITEEDVKTGKVTYIFTSPVYEEKGEEKQNVVSSTFPGVFCDVVGEWKVTYVKGSKHDTKTFDVVDSIKPEFDVASRAYDVWFDAVYELDENNQVKLDEKGRRIFAKDADGNELLGTRYTLPMIFPNDLSELDNDKIEQNLVLDTDLTSDDNKLESVRILPGDKYYVPAVGRFTYTLGVYDIHGNYNEFTASWNAKDPNWVDTSLDDGYLADYDEPGYVNTASSGHASSYWSNTQLSEEWLEEFEGAKGVLKVTAEPNRSSCGAFKFKLFGDSTKADANGKSLVVKYFTPNSVSSIRVGASTWQNQEYNGKNRGVEAVNTVVCKTVPGQWNYAVVSNSQLDYGYYQLGDQNLSEYQICFGERTGPYVNEEIVLYIDSVGLAEELPEVTGYNLTGNVLSWNGITGANGYEVIEDGVTTVVDDNNYTVKNPDAEIRVRAISNDTRYIASNYYSRFVNVDRSTFGENDLAKFNSEKYELSVEKSFRKGRVANDLDVEVLPTYDDESNVLKVVSKTNVDGVGDFRIKLPKTCTDGITVKFMIKQTGVNFFYWLNPAITGSEKSVSDDALIMVNQPLGSMAGVWQYVYIPYSASAVKDVIEVLVYDGANKAEDIVTEVYFADIMNGDHRADLQYQDVKPTLDTLATSLTGNYLADFSSTNYVNAAAYSVPPNRASTITAEYLTSYADSIGATDSGVLKITTTNNSSKRGNVRIYLPKESATGKMTVKFMVEKGSETMWFIDPGTNATEIMSITGGSSKYTVSTTWNYVTIDQSEAEKNCIEFLFANSAVGDTNILYIGCVMEGDQVNYLKQQDIVPIKTELAANLTGNYLADFSNEKYELLVGNQKYAEIGAGDSNYYAASSLSAEYLSSYQGENNVLKITATTRNGGFSIALPKAIGSTGFTIRFMIAQMSDPTQSIFQILNPYAQSASKWEIFDANGQTNVTNSIGKWQTIHVSAYNAVPSGYAEDAVNYVDFRTYTSVSSTKIVYVSLIMEGNQVAALKEADLVATKAELAASLTGDYLADFSSEKYEALAMVSENATNKAAGITAEYLESHADINQTVENNVLKVTSVNNDSKRGNIQIKLPKASATGKMTIKFMVEKGSVTMWFVDPGTSTAEEINKITGGSTSFTASNTWQYMTLDQSNCEKDTIEFLFANSAAQDTNVVYIAWVMDGDQTNN